jgi:hypothetical protein
MNLNETLNYFLRDEGVAGSNPASPTRNQRLRAHLRVGPFSFLAGYINPPSLSYCSNHSITAPNCRLHPRSIELHSKLNGDEDVFHGYGGRELLLSIPIHDLALGVPDWQKSELQACYFGVQYTVALRLENWAIRNSCARKPQYIKSTQP